MASTLIRLFRSIICTPRRSLARCAYAHVGGPLRHLEEQCYAPIILTGMAILKGDECPLVDFKGFGEQ